MARRKSYNAERHWVGRSYKNGKRVRAARDASVLAADAKEAPPIEDAPASEGE